MKSREKMLAFMRKLVKDNKVKNQVIVAANQQIADLQAARPRRDYSELAGIKAYIREMEWSHYHRHSRFTLCIDFFPELIAGGILRNCYGNPRNTSGYVMMMCQEAAEKMADTIMEHLTKTERGL